MQSLALPAARHSADKLNVNGGAIAVGHPFGMTGARITTTLINSLQWHDKQFGRRVDVRRRRHGHGDGAGAALDEPLRRQTAIVTGASRGIGLASRAPRRRRGTGRDHRPQQGGPRRGGRSPRRSGARARRRGQRRRRRPSGRGHPTSTRAFGSVDLLVNNTGINPVYGPHGRARPRVPPAGSSRSTASPRSRGCRRSMAHG